MNQTNSLDRTFSALADPTRRAILAHLMEGEALLKDLAEPFAMTLPAVGKHLKVLEDAELVVRSRDGVSRPCRLNAERLQEAHDWLLRYQQFWEDSFDRIDDLLKTLTPVQAKKKR